MNIYTPMTETMFDGMVAVEEVDEVNLQKLINSDLLLKVYNNFNNKNYENELDQLKAYQQLCRNGYAYVKHSKLAIGRSMAHRGLSLLNIRREIRQTICNHKDVVDIDMDNAHPAIMLQILIEHKIPHASLMNYGLNRQMYRDTIYKCWDLESYSSVHGLALLKDMPKYLMIRLMYGGSINGWERQYNLKSPEKVPTILTNFINEFKNICEVFSSQNPHIKDEIASKKDYNIDGSLVSQIMQQKESQLLEVMIKYMIRRGYIEMVQPGFYKCAPCADGLILSKKHLPSHEQLLLELKVAVFCDTGFNIDFSIKPMGQHYCNTLDEHITKNLIYEIDISRVDRILNASDVLFNSYAKSIYYNENVIRTNVNTRNIMLTNNNSFMCVLCRVVHKPSLQKLYYNDRGHSCLSCHKKSIILEKCDKAIEIKIDKEEKGSQFIKDFYDVQQLDDSVTVINENTRFLSCNANNDFQWREEYANPFLVLDAQMGKGKTQFIKSFLKLKTKGNRIPSILVISQRKSFTHFICNELAVYDIKSYLDVVRNYESHNSICIQIESLHKINTKDKVYDFIILDECETILNQFSSTTMEHVNDSFNSLEYFISQAEGSIFADAFITTRTIEYIKSIKTRRDRITILKNTKLFLEDREAIQINGNDFPLAIIQALISGKKIAVVSTHREDLIGIERAIRDHPKTKHLIVKFYDRFSNKDDLKDVNESWKNADVILYTPVITTGISYTNDKHVFDTIFVNCKNTCQARDLMQMAMRIRNLRDNKIYFALSNRQMFGTPDIAFKSFEEFQDDIRLRGSTILKITKAESLKQQINACMTTFNVDLLRVRYFNMREQSISSRYYQQLCIYLFKRQGYNVIELEEKASDMKIEAEAFDRVTEYSSIESLEYDDVRALKTQDKDKNTQLQVDKYYFENMLVRDLPEVEKSRLFYDYYQNVFRKSILNNVRLEKSNIDIDQLIRDDVVKSDSLIDKMTLKGLKLDHIKKINKLLCLKNSCHSDKIVIKDNAQLMKYLKKNVNSINLAFASKYQFVERNNTRNNLTCFKILEQIYNNWSGLKFKIHQRTKKGTQSYITKGDCIIDYLVGVKPKKTMEEMFMDECE